MNHDVEKRPATAFKPFSTIPTSISPSMEKDGEAIKSPTDDLEASRQVTRPESVSPQPVKVPRARRRGLLGQYTIVAEVEEPKDYPKHTKWFITFVVSMAAVAAPLGSTVIFPALSGITEEFDTTPAVVNLSVALYMLSMSIFPLWWSSFSETLGRRTIYLVSFGLFFLWSILAAVSTGISMLVVMRMLGGGASASVQAVGAGTIADIWAVRERGKAMGVFYLGPLMGPLMGPIIGGLLAGKLGWRSTQWFLVVYGGVLVVLLLLALPETHIGSDSTRDGPQSTPDPSALSQVSSRQTIQQGAKKWMKMAKRFFIDPLKILLYLRFPAVLITIYYVSITFGTLYLLNISLEVTFSRAPYHFSTISVGLTYIPSSVGYILASLFGGRWTDVIMAREARRAGRYDARGKLIYQPEDRMRENAWIAAFLYPTALIWYGWTAEKQMFWVIPLAANFFFGIGSMLIFGMATTMLTEFMPRQASAGVAANNFVRNLCSSVGAIAAEPLIRAVGNGWLFTAVGALALASSVVIWAMRRFGPRWRDSMTKEM